MISRLICSLIVLISVFLSGCASVDKTNFSKESKGKIKVIALVVVDEPEKYFLNPGQAPGGAALYAFGALGGLVLGGIEAARAESATNEFTASIRPTNPEVAKHWNETIAELLRSKGYMVTTIPTLPKNANDQGVNCSAINGTFDAILHTSISTGYSVQSSVEPQVIASVRLTNSGCSETYFADGFAYSARPFGQLTHIPRDVTFSFPTRSGLIAEPIKAKEALRTGLTEIAKRVAAEL
jgi:hypothetical protein